MTNKNWLPFSLWCLYTIGEPTKTFFPCILLFLLFFSTLYILSHYPIASFLFLFIFFILALMREYLQPGETKVIGYNQRDALHPHPYSRNTGTTTRTKTTTHYARYRTSTSSSSSSSSSCNKKCNDTVSLPSIQLKNPQNSSSACGIPLYTSKTYLATRTSRSMGSGSSGGASKSPSFQAQWMFFSNSQWIPLDTSSHLKLERTLQLNGVFVDIQDSHFPGVERIRVFPGADYLSYLGIRYRICRVLLPSLWKRGLPSPNNYLYPSLLQITFYPTLSFINPIFVSAFICNTSSNACLASCSSVWKIDVCTCVCFEHGSMWLLLLQLLLCMCAAYIMQRMILLRGVV